MRVEVPNGCTGIDGPGGQIYRPKKGTNVVEINDAPAFGRLAHQTLGKTPDIAIGFNDTAMKTRTCKSCGFVGFAFKDRPKCARCGR